jgi:hypothetical protein
MAQWDGKPWEAPARTLVLYCPKDQWRYAVYSEAGIMDGYLPGLAASATPDEAQAALVAKVEADTGLTYTVSWKRDKPRWWSADLVVVN